MIPSEAEFILKQFDEMAAALSHYQPHGSTVIKKVADRLRNTLSDALSICILEEEAEVQEEIRRQRREQHVTPNSHPVVGTIDIPLDRCIILGEDGIQASPKR